MINNITHQTWDVVKKASWHQYMKMLLWHIFTQTEVKSGDSNNSGKSKTEFGENATWGLWVMSNRV